MADYLESYMKKRGLDKVRPILANVLYGLGLEDKIKDFLKNVSSEKTAFGKESPVAKVVSGAGEAIGNMLMPEEINPLAMAPYGRGIGRGYKSKPYEANLYRGESEASGIGGIRGKHYTPDEKYAKSYAEDYSDIPGRVIKERVRLKKPLIVDEGAGGSVFNNVLQKIQNNISKEGKSVRDIMQETDLALRVELEKMGYDGVVMKGVGPQLQDEIVVFDGGSKPF